MATTATRKILGQSSPVANTDTQLYVAPASTDTVVSYIAVCNTNATAQTYRIYVRIGGAAAAAGNAEVYDVTIPPNSTDWVCKGLTLATTDAISVRANATGVTFTAHGQENS